jgi:hypothetical protein
MGVKVKDIYDKVRTGEVSKYHFMGWLGMYGFKYKERGFEQGWKACQETEVKALKNPIMQAIAQAFDEPRELSDDEIADIYKEVFKWDVKASDKNWVGLARALIKKASEK